MNNNNQTSGGIGIATVLTIVFIVLKVCNLITWSWVWVLSPLWIGFGLVILLLTVVGLGMLISWLSNSR